MEINSFELLNLCDPKKIDKETQTDYNKYTGPMYKRYVDFSNFSNNNYQDDYSDFSKCIIS